MAMWGLDVDEVNRLAQTLEQASQELQTVLSKISGQLSSTQWNGPDADKFRGDWSSTHTAQLKAVSSALSAVATTARNNASAQQSVSQS